MNYGIADKSYEMILKTISSFNDIDEAILFGSRAMGNAKNGSDIDISLKGENINLEMIVHLSSLLNEQLPLPYYFDILDYNKISNMNLKKIIDSDGKTIYKRENLT